MQKPAAKTSWEPVSDWYGRYLGEAHTLQADVVFPGALKLLAPEAGKHYLDVACGEGSFTRLIANTVQAEVTGIDASTSLIGRARAHAPKNVKYHIADATTFGKLFPYTAFDGAVCILAIQNMDPVESVFREVAKVIKPRRPFVVVMNHPAFRIPKSSSWLWDEEKKIQYRRIDRYSSSYSAPIIAHPGAAPHVKTFSYHRPLEAYMRGLAANGFVVDALEEWASNRVSDSGPKAGAENVARKEIPMFLALRAYKVK